MKTALIALGSNCHFGDILPETLIKYAIQYIQSDLASQVRVSRLFRTPAFPEGAGPAFVNAAVTLRCRQSAGEILRVLHGIEARLGRVRQDRWGPRTMDLDLIALDDEIHPDRATLRHWVDLPMAEQQRAAPDQLILPHPRLQDRAFVLVPLADLVPDWCHPLTGRSIARMLDDLPAQDRAEVVALS